MGRAMHRSHSLDDVSLGLTELASVLKSRRARRMLQSAAKRGQSPVLSLTAAVSASLVSAAATEFDEDPLAGLATVDDLSALSEICLPGETYAEGEEHEHLAGLRALAHAGGHDKPFYLTDPFASPYANAFSPAHEDHASTARYDVHEQRSVGHAQHDTASVSGQHSSQHHGHPSGHQSQAGQSAAAAGEHSQHGPAGVAMGEAIAHGDHHAAMTHDAPHVQSHGAHDAAPGHAGHQAMGDPAPHQTDHAAEMPPENTLHQASADDVDGVRDLIDALSHHADSNGDAMPVADEAATPADDHYSHHASMAMMDLPAADDLTASASQPMI